MGDQDNRAFPETSSSALPGLAPPDYVDPVIEVYKKDVDRTLLRENLNLTVEQRIKNAMKFHQSIEKWRKAGKSARVAAPERGEW
jgi:hypothetical protein